MRFRNIAFLLDSGPRTWSSQEDRHLRLCQALKLRGARPVLVFSNKLPPEMDAKFREFEIDVETINYGDGVAHYYRQLGQLIKKYSIDLVHIVFFDYFTPVAWLARLQGVKTIVYEMQNGGVFRATSWKRTLIHVRNRVMTAPVSRVIAISEYIKGQLVEGGLSEAKIIVRYLGVDTSRFTPDLVLRERWAKDFAIGPDEIVLSTVSYLRPIKSPEIIVQACGMLATRGVPMRLFVAGDGEMLEELKELSQRLGIADRTHWLGLVRDPTSLLQASDLFLLATVGEAFGLVLAESMACGVPVVGSRAGAIPEVVEDGRTGVLVTPRDPVALANAIEGLARDPDLRMRMSRDAVTRVRQSFTLELAVEATIRIYDDL